MSDTTTKLDQQTIEELLKELTELLSTSIPNEIEKCQRRYKKTIKKLEQADVRRKKPE